MLAAGTKLGPYEITGPLGAGGMGEVYRARDTRLGRDVAVKILPESLSGSPESRSRFEREARTISSLNHPHICTLHDVGRQGETDYLVMELVEGETLADRLSKGPLTTEALLKTGIEIADGLEKAHRAGIVHRDLKPDNVMLTRSGTKLMDFGLARARGIAGQASGSGVTMAAMAQSPTMARPLTAEGAIVGTFQYMAPEQLEGKEADARSDLWALGAVLYEAATGKKAFEGKSQASLIGAIMNTEPAPIGSLAPMSPPALERVVKACLAKDPDDRVQTAHDVRMQLEWIRDAGSQAGLPAPVAHRRRSRERLAWGLAAAMTLVAVTAGALLLPRMLRRPVEAPVMRFEVTAPQGVTMTTDAPSTAISPDGRTVVFFATDSSSTPRLWIRPIGSLTAQPMEGTDNASFPFWSPDSRFVGFFADGKLKKVPVGGGSPEVLCDAPDGRGASWSRNGVIVFAPVAAGSIVRVSAGGGESAAITRPDSAKGETGLRWPEFLPDGKHYLFVSLPSHQGSFEVYVGSLDSNEREHLLTSAAAPVYVSPGYLLIVRNGRLMAQRFDASRLQTVGEAVPLGEAPPLSGSAGARAASASETGVLAHPAVGLPNTQLVWLDRSGKAQGTIPVPAGRYESLALSPDGQRLVAGRRSSANSVDLWMIELSRAVATRFTFESSGVCESPVWSPDGQWVAYNSNHAGPQNIYRKLANGAGEPEQLLESSALFKNLTQWTNDGRYLVFHQPDAATGWDVWLLPTTGDRKPVPFLRSRFNEFAGLVSPDGHWMAYCSDESGRQEVYVQSFPTPGNKYQVSTAGAAFGFWSKDGKEMGLSGLDGTLLVAEVTTSPNFTAGAPHALFKQRPDAVATTGTRDLKRFIESGPVGAAAPPSLVLELNWMSAVATK
jgi:serine/threonine protein kinase